MSTDLGEDQVMALFFEYFLTESGFNSYTVLPPTFAESVQEASTSLLKPNKNPILLLQHQYEGLEAIQSSINFRRQLLAENCAPTFLVNNNHDENVHVNSVFDLDMEHLSMLRIDDNLDGESLREDLFEMNLFSGNAKLIGKKASNHLLKWILSSNE